MMFCADWVILLTCDDENGAIVGQGLWFKGFYIVINPSAVIQVSVVQSQQEQLHHDPPTPFSVLQVWIYVNSTPESFSCSIRDLAFVKVKVYNATAVETSIQVKAHWLSQGRGACDLSRWVDFHGWDGRWDLKGCKREMDCYWLKRNWCSEYAYKLAFQWSLNACISYFPALF